VQCPAHEDRWPSLDVATGRDGRTLLYCRAGCRTDDVVAALGLRLGDLFETATAAPQRSSPRSPLDRARAEATTVTLRQPWTRNLERYAAADAIRWADGVSRGARESDAGVWDTLARAAALTTAAENILAGQR
jgi:hypothetical protein